MSLAISVIAVAAAIAAIAVAAVIVVAVATTGALAGEERRKKTILEKENKKIWLTKRKRLCFKLSLGSLRKRWGACRISR